MKGKRRVPSRGDALVGLAIALGATAAWRQSKCTSDKYDTVGK